MPQVYKRAAARRDLIEHYVYLAENADEETADRFLTEAEQTFVELARRPEIGRFSTYSPDSRTDGSHSAGYSATPALRSTLSCRSTSA
jgi:plasmid stabilization system protein ParE